ncbi:MAG: PSD1 and planctomycete cytochrome C domain-containing protein [Pirellulales bacterium]
MSLRSLFLACFVTLASLQIAAVRAPAVAADVALPLSKEVASILERRCLECHGAADSPDGPPKGKLSLTTWAASATGGESGPAIVRGKPEESLLLDFVRHDSDGKAPMPKNREPLTAAEVATLERWIADGAAWPEGNVLRDRRFEGYRWWSLEPIARPAVPQVAGEPRGGHPIDGFIRAKLQEHGLAPSPETEPAVLCRRLYYDLIGLPPTPEQIEAFVAAYRAQPDAAYKKLVDELLASPHYGERWARHWLDVVHFGETHGYDKDKPRENAWPYRDYVIRAFNEDRPYARFVEEQLAGDVLYPDTRDGIEALGFIAAGPWDLIGHVEVPETKTDGKIARHLDRDDMVANTIQTFVSLTVQCAQCHDHKFDPITQEDYYSLQAVFAAVDRTTKTYDLDPAVARRRKELQALAAAAVREREAVKSRIAERMASLPNVPQGKSKKPASEQAAELAKRRTSLMVSLATSGQRLELARSIRRERAATAELRRLGPQQSCFVAAVHQGTGNFRGTGPDGGKPRAIFVLARGSVAAPQKEVRPGALTAVRELSGRFELAGDGLEGERRAALARWIVDRKNPLAWRSIVNRVWQYHFGRGLVDSPNDFGRNGAKPTHPELLDWLAGEFRDGGKYVESQSLKSLHRLIVTSATYRQASSGSDIEAAIAKDADNRLLWRANRRRLDAEALRDSLLVLGGKLDRMMYGPSFRDFIIDKPQHSPHYEYHLHDPNDAKSHRRSIYRFIVRSQPQPFMTTFDCADPSMQTDRRNESLSPLQALALLNNGLTLAMAEHFAERLQSEVRDSPEARISRGFFEATGRAASKPELAELAAFAEKHGLAAACRVMLNLNEFMFVD